VKTVVGVLAMIAIAVVWTFSPGATILLIGGAIGVLGAAAWAARKMGI
jgi:hypothetical protein